MAGIKRIDNEQSAAALADLLNGNTRRRPVAVVTIPAGHDEPWIDVEALAREAGNLAEVYVMPTGSCTWEFSRRMADGTQVYGGAGRVYAVGHVWAADLSKSPLRFAFNANDGHHATQQLISDTLRMAAADGHRQSRPARELRQVRGVVKGTVAGRAMVGVGNLVAAIAEELTVADVRIARIVTAGQRVEGWFDAETGRIDITPSLRTGSDALASYAIGDVVLTKVAMVSHTTAELMLYPKTTTPAVTVAVLRDDVTTNPFDDLRTLMTVGEVIPARVVATGPQWALVLNDVDDDEPVRDAPSLLAGGPPWLVEEPDEAEIDEPQSVAPPALPMPTAAPEPVVVKPAVIEAPAPRPTPSRPSPTPALFDRNRPRPVPSPSPGPAPTPEPAEPTRALLLKVDRLTAEVNALKRDHDNVLTQLVAGTDEREQLRYLLDQAERRANKGEHDLKAARARLRKAGNTKSSAVAGDGPQFADAEEGFRYLVLTQWATRTLPSEQRDRPLPAYVLGHRFLDSLASLEGIKAEKVADVVFEIVTGLAPQIPSREVHQLRMGPGGGDPVRRREDGAVAWRASLQVKTPSARRIHYWVLPSGQVELARVTTHDDFDA
ncbi:MAG: hypothetical protein ACOYBY_10240 [Dermatophilaceae bacterium]